MTHPIIKPTSLNDVPELQEVLDKTGLFPADMLPDMLGPAIADGTKAFWLTCHVDRRAVGLCYTVTEDLTVGTWNMLALGIHPDNQAKGLGSALVQATEQRLRQASQRLMIVETSGLDGFAPARSFYAKNGYAEEARVRDFWNSGDDKVIFRKVL